MKGAELLSALPNGWKAVPIKSACYYTVSNVDKHALKEEIPVRLCNYTDVYKNEQISPDLELMAATATEEEIEKFHLEVGDVLITKDSESWDDIGIPAYVAETAEDLLCGYHLAIMRPTSALLDGRFLFRCAQSRPVNLQLELEATGVTRYGVPKGAIGNVIIPLPPPETQRRIADYLDRETARIDALVAEKGKMLSLLEEKRAALICQAVTRGLTPDAPLKPSGLDWLGDIPAHWEMRRLKYTATINEDTLSETTDPDHVMAYIDIGNVDSRGTILGTTAYKFGDAPSRARRIVQHGDVIVSTVRTYLQAIAPIEHPPDNLIVSTGFAVVRPRGGVLDVNYCKYALRDKRFLWEVERDSTGVSYPAISATDLADISICLPALEEQRQIAEFLDRETARIDAVVVEQEKMLALIEERRSALITAAVTGQLPLEETAP